MRPLPGTGVTNALFLYGTHLPSTRGETITETETCCLDKRWCYTRVQNVGVTLVSKMPSSSTVPISLSFSLLYYSQA